MKQRISAHLAPTVGQISAPTAPIDNQSQYAQTSAQIVRKNKYAIISLSLYYTSRPKQKKCTYQIGATGIFFTPTAYGSTLIGVSVKVAPC